MKHSHSSKSQSNTGRYIPRSTAHTLFLLLCSHSPFFQPCFHSPPVGNQSHSLLNKIGYSSLYSFCITYVLMSRYMHIILISLFFPHMKNRTIDTLYFGFSHLIYSGITLYHFTGILSWVLFHRYIVFHEWGNHSLVNHSATYRHLDCF